MTDPLCKSCRMDTAQANDVFCADCRDAYPKFLDAVARFLLADVKQLPEPDTRDRGARGGLREGMGTTTVNARSSSPLVIRGIV